MMLQTIQRHCSLRLLTYHFMLVWLLSSPLFINLSTPIRRSADSFQGWQHIQSPANKLLFIELIRSFPKCPSWSPGGLPHHQP